MPVQLCGKSSIVHIDIILDDESGIELAVNDCLPSFAMRQKAGDFGLPQLERVVGTVQRTVIDGAHIIIAHIQRVHCIDDLRLYRQALDQSANMFAALCRALEMDDEMP